MTDATIQISFIGGFLPQTGDTVLFLMAEGGLTMDNVVMVYEGAADGFQFELVEENGMLVFEALNDAQPDLTSADPIADLNGDNKIDAIDLLILLEQMNETDLNR